MNDLFQGFGFISAYIDNLLILTKLYWIDHLHKLELNINKLKESGLKFNIEEFFFEQTEIEYLCLWITRDSIKSIY